MWKEWPPELLIVESPPVHQNLIDVIRAFECSSVNRQPDMAEAFVRGLS